MSNAASEERADRPAASFTLAGYISASILRSTRRQVAFLLLLGAILCLPSLSTRDLWNPDEPRYAEVSREMLVLDEYLVPHLNGEIYSQKPPLFFWLSAALQAAGLGFGAGRLVAGAAALGTLLLVWALGRLWFTDRAALAAATVLATIQLFARIGRAGVLDVPLAFCTTLAVYGWWRHRLRGGRSIVWFYVGMAAAVLVKGPVGIVIPLLAVAGAVAARAGPGRGGRHALWGVPLTLALIAAWLVPACLRGGAEYTEAILFKQNLGRAVGSWSHPRPWWYYAQYVILDFFPWIVFAPTAAVAAWKKGRDEPALRAILLWFLFGLLFFSALSGKRERYLIPLYPALALVVGVFLDRGAERFADRIWLRRAAAVPVVVFGVIGLGLLAGALAGGSIADVVAERNPEVAAAVAGVAELPAALALAACGGLLLAGAWRGLRLVAGRDLESSAALILAQALLFFLAYDLLVTPRVNEVKSAKEIAEALNEWQGEAEVAAFPAHFAGAFNLYSGRLHIVVLESAAEVDSYLAGAGRRLVLTARAEYERPRRGEERALVELLGAPHHATPAGRVGRRRMLFLTNYEPPPSAAAGSGSD